MKNQRFKILILIIMISITTSVIGSFANAKINVMNQSSSGFVAPQTNNTLSLNDGLISDFWINVTQYQDISEFGNGGFVKFANNGTHLFSLMVAQKDSIWISIEFEPDPDECMINLNDGWTMYIDENTYQVVARDIKFEGYVIPDNDAQNDLRIESIVVDDYVQIEVVRPFDTGDTNGYDITFSNGSVNVMQFASMDDHIGTHEDFFVFVTDQSIDGIDGSTGDDSITIPIDIDLPTGFNLNQLKFTLLGLTPLGVFVFIMFHVFRRVITRPIKHGYERVVTNDHKPPTFMERWRETFSSNKP